MKTHEGVEEIFHASSAEIRLADMMTGELQAPAALSHSDPYAQWNWNLNLWIIWHYYPRNTDAKNARSLIAAPPVHIYDMRRRHTEIRH